MTTRHKVTGRASSVPAGLAAGALVSILMTAIICIIGGWMIGSEMIEQNKIGYFSITALISSSILGSVVASKKVQRKQFLITLASGGIYFAILTAVTIIFFRGSFRGMGVTFLTVMIGTLASALLTIRGQKARIGRQHKKIHR